MAQLGFRPVTMLEPPVLHDMLEVRVVETQYDAFRFYEHACSRFLAALGICISLPANRPEALLQKWEDANRSWRLAADLTARFEGEVYLLMCSN